MPKNKVIIARTAQSAAERVIAGIDRNNGSDKHIVIAPDAFTLAIEKEISAKQHRKGLFDVEVMSFARLAQVLLKGEEKQCLSPAGSVMLMEKVIRSEKEELEHYKRVAGASGFAQDVYAAVTAVRNSGVQPEDLKHLVENRLLDGNVLKKTHDIALLYEGYLRALKETREGGGKKDDGTTRLERLIEKINASDGALEKVSFYVVDHIDLNAKQLEVVAALMQKSAGVTVAVVDHPQGAANESIYPPLKLRIECLTKDASIDVVWEKESQNPLAGVKSILADSLFSYSYPVFSKEKDVAVCSEAEDKLHLLEAKDIEEEVTYLATEITRRIRKEKTAAGVPYRFSDVAIIAPSFEEYLPVVRKIFRRYRIPLFADRRIPLSESPLFLHILLAMELPSKRRFHKLAVLKYVMHDLFAAKEGEEPFAEEEKSAFADYLDKSGYGAGENAGSDFKTPFALYPEDALFAPAERIRAAFYEEVRLFDQAPESASVRTYAELLINYLKENAFDERVEAYLTKIRAYDLSEQAEVIRQVPGAIMTLLEELVELRGEDVVTLAEFSDALTAGATQVKIAALPVSLDCVYFAPVKQAMYAPIPLLFVLGAESGLFPSESFGEGILRDSEYSAWSLQGITIRNTGVEQLKESRYHAVQLMLRGERTYLSRIESGNPSPVYQRVGEVFSLTPVKCGDALLACDVDDRIPTREVADVVFVEYSRKYKEGVLTKKEEIFARALAAVLKREFPLTLSEGEEICLQGGGVAFNNDKTSVSQLETYFTCPYKHFVQYELGAKEKDVASFDLSDTGNVIHKCMELLVRDMILRGDFSFSEARVRAKVKKYLDAILNQQRYKAAEKALGKSKLSRVRRRAEEVAVFAAKQIAASHFKPIFTEKFFPEQEEEEGKSPSSDPLLKTITIDGVSLTGKIDRVDALRTGETLSVAAIDYKTGSAKISTEELFVGKKIQLPVYLSVLRASGYDPFASFYFKLSDGEREGEHALSGAKRREILRDGEQEKELVELFDPFISVGDSPYTGITKEGDSVTDPDGTLLSKESFDAQVEYARLVAEKAIREIKKGYLRPTPLKVGEHPSCEYCPAKGVCRQAGKLTRVVKTIKPDVIERVVHEAQSEYSPTGTAKED